MKNQQNNLSFFFSDIWVGAEDGDGETIFFGLIRFSYSFFRSLFEARSHFSTLLLSRYNGGHQWAVDGFVKNNVEETMIYLQIVFVLNDTVGILESTHSRVIIFRFILMSVKRRRSNRAQRNGGLGCE